MNPSSPTPPLLVVGHDGSVAADPVVDWALALAAPLGARLDLVHAVTLPQISTHDARIGAGELLDRHEALARSALEAARRRIAAAGVDCRVVVRRWLPAETLLEHARAAGAGMIVVGQHSGRAHRLLLGSTSGEVARDADLPVAVVRGERATAPPRRVLLAADGSPCSLRAAAVLATWLPDAEVVALLLRDGGAPDVEPGELSRRLAAAGLAAERLDLRVGDGPPAQRLLETARAEPFDLVVAGRRGHGGWLEQVLGSVAEKLLQLAPCPVLLAH